jgi:bifunctional DNA-binding transcriptional regulator/antitoxin component of YhaV-PrlF toxin-antitoxin module
VATETADVVEFLATTRLGEKGQLTILKEYRQSLDLDPGSPIAVVQVGNALPLIPEQGHFRNLCDRVARVFSSRGMTADDVVSTLPEARERVYAELYPALVKRKGRKSETLESEARMSRVHRPRLFRDSNVLTGGILAPWGLDKAVLSLCAARIFRMVLAEVARREVETNLLSRASSFGEREARRVVVDYLELIQLARPEIVALPSAKRGPSPVRSHPSRSGRSRPAVRDSAPS